MCKEAFKLRPEILHVRMFDRYTNSNAEAEHHALKKKSLGLQANSTLHTLHAKTELAAKVRHSIRKQQEHRNVITTDATSLCSLSTYVTKPCFQDLEKKVQLAQDCISKQISNSEWKVIYQRKKPFDVTVLNNSFLPYIKRIRTVTKDSNGFLRCSCKGFERYGYPCHHLLHVLKCYETKNIKREWVHIRWTNVYSRYQYSSDTTDAQRATYSFLYDNCPVGPKHVSNGTITEFPIYVGYNHMTKRSHDAFDVPTFQIMSRTLSTSTWIGANNTTDSKLKRLLGDKNDSLIQSYLFPSQENTSFSQPINDKESDTFDIDDFMSDNHDNMACDHDAVTTVQSMPLYPQHFSYQTHNVVLKRAVDLCGNDLDLHKRLYDTLNEFNNSIEINHKDNQRAIEQKNKTFAQNGKSDCTGGVTLISSNKVVNKLGRSTKRTKYSYEK